MSPWCDIFAAVVRSGPRLQPGETRWQLEQQRPELPLGESQQQLAWQPQQQPRLPPRQFTGRRVAARPRTRRRWFPLTLCSGPAPQAHRGRRTKKNAPAAASRRSRPIERGRRGRYRVLRGSRPVLTPDRLRLRKCAWCVNFPATSQLPGHLSQAAGQSQ